MLKNGDTVFDCQVIELLVENDIYQGYLMNCPDSALSKLIVTCPDPLFDKIQQKAFFEHAEWLVNQAFPGVGTPLKVGESDGQPACLYPVPAGLPLEKHLHNDFTPRQIIQLLKDVSSCLSIPHSAGLCHGNLSPETLHLDGMTPYLADFSLGQLLRLDYHSGINPRYTSPEQVRGETPGTSADLYSLGCILYRLLTGESPFVGDDSFAIAKQHLLGEFPRLPDTLALFQPLLEPLVSLAPDERIVAEELCTVLDALLSDDEIDQVILPSRESELEHEKGIVSASPLEQTVPSDMAARVEERLKEHQEDFTVDAPVDIPPLVAENSSAELETLEIKKRHGVWRFGLVLLLGIVIGCGAYFFMNPQRQQPPISVETAAVKEKIEPTDPVAPNLDVGLQLWQKNDLVGAETEFKKVISAFKNDPRAYNNLAAFYAAQGNYEQARDYLEQALATSEEYATIYHNLGSIYAEMARGSYGRALQLDKSHRLISLPVFSTQGVVSLTTESGKNVALQKATLPATVAAVAAATEEISTPPAEKLQQNVSTSTETSSPVEPSPAVAPAKEETKMVQTEEVSPDKKEPELEAPDIFLQRWAEAWSNQNVGQYLSFYSDTFIPPGGKSRQVWEKQRRQRLKAPRSISVNLDDFKLTAESADQMKVEVVQSYRSDIMTDKTKKIFNLQRDGKSWKIARERSLGVVR